ncbi:glycosyltransferase involved in cell wall biosynthesis [Inquilinus ginsengisoli]|uniref:Glycosyltransferase involved in cell wall biosynthesis n=1 Tax=Inquilinus ginsengisoli TaxID=363840 RepID=A0ABU1JI56_9PROT|nr:glycosyltransferase family 4 protein [Inquilinus ginsengisoli]MDR6288251.1 glycosyltransferase involved in cell wall biosynthesis [Inquilinus ginsengisoli]
MKEQVVVSQLGARMDYAVPRILNAHGALEHFYTDICAIRGWPRLAGHVPPRFLPRGVRRLVGRKPSGIPPQRMTCFTNLGLSYALRRMRANGASDEMEAALDAGRRLSELVVRHGFGEATGFYGFVRECLEQLQAARSRGLWTAVEQNIAARETVDRLAWEEQERFPDWERPAMPTASAEAFGTREKAEWAEADMIVCPSEFVRQTVADSGGPAHRCIVVPYGVDTRFQIPVRNRQQGPLRVLTIGTVGLRKGSPYILEAARQMRGQAVFRMVGSGKAPAAAHAGLDGVAEFTGPIPRLEIIAQYAWADVFLLPSLCEGSATVIYEALAAGLPVVTTLNSGSVVRDGIDGFIVPIRDAGAITNALRLLHDDRAQLFEMSHNARFRARDFDLPSYGRRLCDALDQARAAATIRAL